MFRYFCSTVTTLDEDWFLYDSPAAVCPPLFRFGLGLKVAGWIWPPPWKVDFGLVNRLCFLMSWNGFGLVGEPEVYCCGKTFSKVWFERLLFSSIGTLEVIECEDALLLSVNGIYRLCLFSCGVMPPTPFLVPGYITVPVPTCDSYWLYIFAARFFCGGLWKGTLPSYTCRLRSFVAI